MTTPFDENPARHEQEKKLKVLGTKLDEVTQSHKELYLENKELTKVANQLKILANLKVNECDKLTSENSELRLEIQKCQAQILTYKKAEEVFNREINEYKEKIKTLLEKSTHEKKET